MAVKLTSALVLLVWLGMSVTRLQDWRSERALWTRAVAISPTLPRPLLNLAVQLRKAGEIDDAVSLLLRAVLYGDADMRARVRQQLQWMQAFGHDVCSRPHVQPYCY